MELDERTVRFRHPLMRSAVRQGADVERRRRVHDALAQTLEAEPDRRVWHRAARVAGTREDVALEPAPRPRRPRPTDGAGTSDRAPRGRRPLQPRDRPTALPLPPHDRHAPLPDFPKLRISVARVGERRGRSSPSAPSFLERGRAPGDGNTLVSQMSHEGRWRPPVGAARIGPASPSLGAVSALETTQPPAVARPRGPGRTAPL
jgi:hypothetical protein